MGGFRVTWGAEAKGNQERKTSNVRNARNVRTGNYNRKGSSCELVRAHCRSRSSQRLELCNKVHSNTTAYGKTSYEISSSRRMEKYGVSRGEYRLISRLMLTWWGNYAHFTLGNYSRTISRFM